MQNADQARRFLALLSRRGRAPFTFFTTDDTRHDRRLTATLHGTFDEHADVLRELNDRGAGVFVTVNETDGRGRKAENVTRLRAVFTDADAPMTRPYAIRPTVIVRTPRGEHAYWTVWPDAALEAFTPAQRQLAAYYGTDTTVCDLPRVMRLPGFFHRKREPRMVRIASFDSFGDPSSLQDVLDAHPIPPQVVRPASAVVDGGNFTRWAWCHEATEGTRNRTAFSIAAEGFRRGLEDEDVTAVVTEWCAKAGIKGEAVSIIRSARRHNERRSA